MEHGAWGTPAQNWNEKNCKEDDPTPWIRKEGQFGASIYMPAPFISS